MNYAFLIALLCAPFFTWGQAISGTIRNTQQHPIVDVQVLNLSNGLHAHTDEDGYFSIQQSKIGDTLKFYHMAYQSINVVVKEEKLRVVLKDQLLDLQEIVILPTANNLNLITAVDDRITPVNSSQEILRKVPGLFIGQHAGGGKAEQIFLRGFDIDHGTDIALQVDGMPVNMVSHAHGQGYADLHFLIPETVEKIDFGKGLYYADKGNFNTAGYVDFQTKDRLDNSLIKLEVGQFNTLRTLGMFSILNQEKHSAYAAIEYNSTDGPFESPQNFNRLNLFAKYTGKLTPTDKISTTFSHFTSKWDASGQIPQRAVDNGSISRFGAIDDTEGGNTSRSNILLNYNKIISSDAYIKSSLYYSKYDFQLFSNFTFFLEDSLNGDQIKQQEDRSIIGLQSTYYQTLYWNNVKATINVGINLRHDNVADNELSRTRNRKETLEQLQFGDVQETNLGAFANASFELGK